MSEVYGSKASGPSLWEVMAADPSIPMDRATLRLVISDQRRPHQPDTSDAAHVWLRSCQRTGRRSCRVFGSASPVASR